MSDKDLCALFDTTLEEVEETVQEFEQGDGSNLRFGPSMEGRPRSEATMKTTSFKLYDFELAAIDRAAAKEGISRSAFIRRACDRELVALA